MQTRSERRLARRSPAQKAYDAIVYFKPRTAASSTAVGGAIAVAAVFGAVVAPAEGQTGAHVRPDAAGTDPLNDAQLNALRGTEGAARSAERPAIAAPAAHSPQRRSYGLLGSITVSPKSAAPKTSAPDGKPTNVPDKGADSSFLGEAQRKGLVATAQRVYAAVRTNFPSITDIGGYRAGDSGDHGSGHAVDVMCPGQSATGDAVAAYAMAHASELNIKYVIWKQRIWFPGTGAWRAMEDRGSVTANHFDHVHISVN